MNTKLIAGSPRQKMLLEGLGPYEGELSRAVLKGRPLVPTWYRVVRTKLIALFLYLPVAALLLWACTTTTTRQSPESWNRITDGMSRAAVVSRLGLPDRTAENVDCWQEDGWELRAEYDPGGNVRNVVRTLILK